MPRQLLGTAIAANTITTTQLQTTIVNNITQGGGPRVTSLIYPGNDTAANTVGGQTVYVLGSGFASNATVYINGSAVPALSFISASNLQITTPALSSATYPVYVINPETGATAIHIPGLIVSGEPSWVTSAGSLSSSQDELTAWSYTLSATGDTPITYALASGNTLPSGVTLAANGLISGTISSPSGTATTYTFSVVATDAQNQDSTRQFTVTTSTGEGVLFANNVLLIHADGTNNGNNHAFVDSSNNNFTITRNGNATQGSFSPFSQTGWSNYFDGSGDYLTIGNNSAFALPGDFTIELWAYFNTNTTSIFCGNINSSGYGDWAFFYNNVSGVRFITDNASTTITGAYAVTLSKWTHFAISRSGSSVRIFADGVLLSTTTNSSTNNFGGTMQIGRTNDGSLQFPGYMSNLRIVKGTALYTSAFTPPTSPLTAISNTSLLTCQSNRFIDNSTNAFTITRNGDVSIQAFSPFAPAAAYSTSTVGGSAYFDGSGDYLTTADSSENNFGSSDWTIEFWVNSTQTTRGDPFGWNYSFNNSGWGGLIFNLSSSGDMAWYEMTNSRITASSTKWNNGAWNHVAVSRSGNSVKMFLNGTQVGSTYTTSATYGTNPSGFMIGAIPGGTAFAGYISNFRIVKGTAVYTSNFTPPTAPVTNIANTSLLLNFTNAQIFDQTAKNVLETVGDAKISTSVYKYGTGSIAFDGTGDNITIPSSPNLDFGTGDFTIELWANFSALSTNRILLDKWASGNANSWQLYWRASGTSITFLVGASTVLLQDPSTSRITTNTWYHIAVTRSGSTNRLFIDGVEVASATNSTNLTNTNRLCIGEQLTTLTNDFSGYIDDLRITKGYARYTSNFTPPTSALKDK